MSFYYPTIERNDSKIDACAKGGMYTPEEARALDRDLLELNELAEMEELDERGIKERYYLLAEIETRYANVLNNLRVQRTIVFKCLFLGATRSELEQAQQDWRPSAMGRLLGRVRKRHYESTKTASE